MSPERRNTLKNEETKVYFGIFPIPLLVDSFLFFAKQGKPIQGAVVVWYIVDALVDAVGFSTLYI